MGLTFLSLTVGNTSTSALGYKLLSHASVFLIIADWG